MRDPEGVLLRPRHRANPDRRCRADFEWNAWASLSQDSCARTLEIWDRDDRENEPPMFGWLSANLPGYDPATLHLKTNVHTQPIGQRPLIELEPTDHPLAVEQREGITLAELLLHHD